jgi:glycosyltransferase involved in cell wall biosynthesis
MRKKIAFFCGPDRKFLGDIVDHFSNKKAEYEVRVFHSKEVRDFTDTMAWSDISWFEWCDYLLIHASKLPKVCKIICRLHSYEAFTEMPSLVNWENVDVLIFVSQHIRDIVLQQAPEIGKSVYTPVVHNGVDLDKFTFTERQKGFSIAYVGYINHKKNPSLLLQCIRHLADIDDRYVLHLAGEYQDLRYKLYFDHMLSEMRLGKNVVLHGWVDDISSWLEDKHFIVCTSVLESFCYALAEGMARGLKPLIHNFVGARNLYPGKYLFNTIGQFAQMVLNEDYNPREYRQFVEDNYPLTLQIQRLDRILVNTCLAISAHSSNQE